MQAVTCGSAPMGSSGLAGFGRFAATKEEVDRYEPGQAQRVRQVGSGTVTNPSSSGLRTG